MLINDFVEKKYECVDDNYYLDTKQACEFLGYSRTHFDREIINRLDYDIIEGRKFFNMGLLRSFKEHNKKYIRRTAPKSGG